MESLICTVKSAVVEGSTASCSVFMLSDPEGLVGKTVSHYREEVRIGSWRVVSYERTLVLERVHGDEAPQMADYLTGEVLRTEPPPPSRRQFGHHLVFEGKNWKLASEKKWREKLVDIAGFEHVGDTTVKGRPHRVLKGPEFFVAVRVESPEPT